jgi:hypothetical protein
MIRPISLGTRLGFGAVDAPGAEAVVALTPLFVEVPELTVGAADTEPCVVPPVVEVGPATAVEVSELVVFDEVAAVVEAVVSALAATADLVPLPLQAEAMMAIEMRTERYIFPS